MNARLWTRLALPSLLAWLLVIGAASSAEIPVRVFELTIPGSASTAEPRVLRVSKDDAVRLSVTSEAAGEIHLHAYRLEAKVAPGVPAEWSFKAHATGRFRIEWHPAGGKVKKGDHQAPPLAVLEVRPK